MKEFRPNTSAEIKTAILDALSRDCALAICGGGSKAGLGGEVNSDWVLNTSNLTGILDYEPNELVLTARAGTSISEIDAVLKEAGQHLSFEPPDWQLFLGNEGSIQTLGGVIASNFSGPRRIATGAARDFFLGLEMVTGRGDIIKSGGKVVKNVTGYDLCKLLAGSYGTLGVLTEVTVKCQPLSEKVRTVLVLNLSEKQAIE
ncbi:MAG: FAD-binding protein, partial [Rhodospirillaceae bacterium]